MMTKYIELQKVDIETTTAYQRECVARNVPYITFWHNVSNGLGDLIINVGHMCEQLGPIIRVEYLSSIRTEADVLVKQIRVSLGPKQRRPTYLNSVYGLESLSIRNLQKGATANELAEKLFDLALEYFEESLMLT